MAWWDQHPFELRLDWGPDGVGRAVERRDTVVIVDVLSFSTCVAVATARGCRIVPCARGVDPGPLAVRFGAVAAMRRGEGEPSLSPASFSSLPEGACVVLPSPNGSACAAAANAGAKVFVASLANASAVAREAAAEARPVAVIACGERWPDDTLRVAAEDLVGAGAVLSALPGRRSPEAETAVAAFRRARSDLLAFLAATSSGQELCERGYRTDVEIAARYDHLEVVPVVSEGVICAHPR